MDDQVFGTKDPYVTNKRGMRVGMPMYSSQASLSFIHPFQADESVPYSQQRCDSMLDMNLAGMLRIR